MAADTYFNTHQIPKVQSGNEAVYVDILSDVQWNVDFVGITLLCFDIFTIFMLILTRLKYKLGNFLVFASYSVLSFLEYRLETCFWNVYFIFMPELLPQYIQKKKLWLYSELKDIKAVVGIAKNIIQTIWIEWITGSPLKVGSIKDISYTHCPDVKETSSQAW